jgi:hypothetical protein
VNGILLDHSGMSPAEKRAALLVVQGGKCATVTWLRVYHGALPPVS